MSNDSAAASSTPQEGKVQVRYGLQTYSSSDFVGKSVRQVREALAKQLSIPGDASAFRGKTKLSDDEKLTSTDMIEFIKRQGEKGLLTR